MIRPLPPLWFSLAAALCAAACSPVVGDPCSTAIECGTDLLCDQTLPGGYCTLPDCGLNGCPEDGLCVVFPNQEEWCMAPCSAAGDCREGYSCIDEETFLLLAQPYEATTIAIALPPGDFCGVPSDDGTP